MIYLSGCVTQTQLANPRPDLGLMLQPGMGNVVDGRFQPWAADNGCYAQGERFQAGDWLEWLAGLRRYRERCLFAVAPDVIGHAEATCERSRPYLATIRQLGYRAAYVAQNGQERFDPPWSEFDCLFVGGTDWWKFSEPAYQLVTEAKARGKWTHQGRVNSLRRLIACQVSAFDSADGTFVAFGPDRNLPQVYDWLDTLQANPILSEASV